ncbi:hypothetical protein CONCODRAFT_7390 [Conidiobolus coronatus NRRL 28638]|uniref:Uncharacterized protein n=1 Tax=Conidiobolus coronatus (strain ATCC 28846 / CBS 209.66 / NRRL 28638) TaxID=796925 RepID=A0A137P559_CONC2|nr:hypothetical protein CONCODRAFT_7390 [Conidiobolus coronatus NRRL 28638]|eukprot:KXN70147.1 hypothetical protein CONCODRAFT_7390 [Conidiobolus coronatus NRRL 28638]
MQEAKNLSLRGVLSTVHNLVDYYHKQREQEASLDETLLEIVNGLDNILLDRCAFRHKKGKNAGRTCLKARYRRPSDEDPNKFVYFGSKCAYHTPKKTKDKFKDFKSYTDTNIESQSQVDLLETALTPPKQVTQKYYPDPSKELQHLYDQLYLDSSNTVVEKVDASNYHWVLICKLDREKRLFKEFSKNVVSELKRQQSVNHFDYVVDDSREYFKKIDIAKALNFVEKRERQCLGEAFGEAFGEPLYLGNFLQLANLASTSELNKVIDKEKYYNKYSRAPKIDVSREEMMNSTEFVQFYSTK